MMPSGPGAAMAEFETAVTSHGIPETLSVQTGRERD